LMKSPLTFSSFVWAPKRTSTLKKAKIK
jgi:hypothetical protein